MATRPAGACGAGTPRMGFRCVVAGGQPTARIHRTVKEFDAAVAKVDKSKPIPVLLRRGELATYLLIRPQH